MRAKLMALAFGVALTAGTFVGPAAQAECKHSHTGSEPINVQNPATNGYIYADGDTSGGYIGVRSADGATYGEIKGDSGSSSLYFHGANSTAGTSGKAGIQNGAPVTEC